MAFRVAIAFLLAGIGFLVFQNGVRKRLSFAVLISSIGLFIALSLCFYKFTVDDAYISLRYARNLASGYGLVYSTDGSAPVEGYTNFLWVIIETPLFLLNLPDEVILNAIKVIGIIFGVGIIILTYKLTCLLASKERAGSVAALFTAAIPYLSFWAIGGLETTMYIFWLMAGLYSYIVEDRNNKAHILSMVLFTLMSLTRPEGLFFVSAVLLWEGTLLIVCLRAKNKVETLLKIRAIIPGIVVFVLLYGIYFIWRYEFYGFLLPNTFYARSGACGIKQIVRRLYEMHTFLSYLLPVAALASFTYFKFPKNSERGQGLLTIASFTLLAFTFVSKREWMPGFRYELPFVPILLLFFAVSVDQILFHDGERAVANWQRYVRNLVFLLFVGMYLFHPTTDLLKNRDYTDQLNRAHVALGKWLKRYANPDASYASWDMGAVPYYSGLSRIIEIHPEGILSNYITHNEYDVNYFLSLNPSFVVLPKYNPTDNRANYINSFYLNSKFKEEYQLIFSFAFMKDYILAVHKHHNVYIPQAALEEGKRIADKSLREAGLLSENCASVN